MPFYDPIAKNVKFFQLDQKMCQNNNKTDDSGKNYKRY